MPSALGNQESKFQSTRPVKGATYYPCWPPDGRRVSIHAPREGRDLPVSESSADTKRFQSTRPVKGATFAPLHAAHLPPVSIHAPREGRDVVVSAALDADRVFQSTRPVKGATSSSAPRWTPTGCFNPRAP